jgi:glucosyl-3-phosphoglycerate synthase
MPANRASISVCFPARNERETIAGALRPMLKLRDDDVLSQVVVVDESTDGTAQVADAMGAEVYGQSELMAEFGPVAGKGDAIWRSLSVLTGDVVIWLDADCTSVSDAYALGLAEPILSGDADLVKARYQRPLGDDPNGGGRVNHLLARPLLRRFFPDLTEIRQPLSGESAIRRDLAMSLPFVCGYGVEMGLLIDAHERGARIEEVDLGVQLHRHRSLEDLASMADEVLDVAISRRSRGRMAAVPSRPPMKTAQAKVPNRLAS